MRRTAVTVAIVALLVPACSAAGDAAFEKTIESQLGYDVEIYYDENGERQVRPVDGAAALEIDFDRSRLGDVPVPDGFVATDDRDSDAQWVRVSFLKDDGDAATAADAYQESLESAGWTVTRNEYESAAGVLYEVEFERGIEAGAASFQFDDSLRMLRLSLRYSADTTPGGGLELPDPATVVDRTERDGGFTEFTVEGTDGEALARSYAAQLEAAGWTIDTIEPNEEGAWSVIFNGPGTLGAVQVFVDQEAGTATLLVRFL